MEACQCFPCPLELDQLSFNKKSSTHLRQLREEIQTGLNANAMGDHAPYW